VIDFKKGHPLPLMSASMGALILLCLTACAHMGEVGDTPKLTFKGRKILVMPMRDMAQIYGENKSVISPLTGKYFTTGMVMEGSEKLLTDELVTFIKDRPDYLYFPISQGEGEAASLMTNNHGGLWDKQFFAEMGRSLKADAVLTGCIYRFQERVGTRHSVDIPASVEFDLHLIDSVNGSIVWSGFYNETQQSLSENFLNIKTFIKRKGRWITAEEMAVSGLLDVLRTFPDYGYNTGN
jgi:hypothetical protein